MKKNSKIYVAGHRGMVGCAIVKKLKQKGYSNLILRTHSQLDLTDQLAVHTFFKKEKPEYVFLAAAKVGGILANNTHKADFIYENLMIQNNVIYQSYLSKVKKLLFLGSSCIYPKDAPQPIKEEYLLSSPLEPTNEPYAIAKVAGIKMCESFNLQYGTNFISVMPTNLYGPNDNFDFKTSHAFPALLRRIHLGKLFEMNRLDEIQNNLFGNSKNLEITKQRVLKELEDIGIIAKSKSVQVEIWGTGKPRREFLHCDDLADVCFFIMNNVDFKTLSKNRNSHINIGVGKDISIKELVELIKKIVGFNGEFYFNSDKPDGTMLKRMDITKLKTLGWRHKIELVKGIKKVYEWYVAKSKK